MTYKMDVDVMLWKASTLTAFHFSATVLRDDINLQESVMTSCML